MSMKWMLRMVVKKTVVHYVLEPFDQTKMGLFVATGMTGPACFKKAYPSILNSLMMGWRVRFIYPKKGKA